jgi:hypothetical protein
MSIQPNPVLIFCPYLDLREGQSVGDWDVTPIATYSGRWRDNAFEKRARQFLARFQNPDGRPITNPSLVTNKATGADGALPGSLEVEALQLALHLGLLDTNPAWAPGLDGNWIATSDNSELFIWPLDVDGGGVATQRGAIVKVLTGGYNVDDPSFSVRAPLELHLPIRVRVNGELAGAIYHVVRGDHDEMDAGLARRMATAIRWLAKSWRNSQSIGPEDQIVFLRTALEALTGTSKAEPAIRHLEETFDRVRTHGGGDARFTEHLLWSPDDHAHRSLTLTDRAGGSRELTLSDLGHWFSSFGQARHQIVHQGLVPQLTYEEKGSRYNGPLFHVGERFTREAIKASLIAYGYDDLWQEEAFRAIKRVFAGLDDSQ